MFGKVLVAALFAVVAQAQDWTPPVYPPEVYNAFYAKRDLNPPETPDLNTWNPYDGNTNTTVPEGWVCAVHYPNATDRSTYYLVQYQSRVAAEEAGDFVTHAGLCGLCSNLNDMALYMEKPDLTTEGRTCALKLIKRQKQRCFEDVGFTSPCARIWVENTIYTRDKCFFVCLRWANKPNNDPPDSYNLNPCLQCDEDNAGPVFKAVAGRTRRNSGLLSAINRPPESIYRVEHDYY